MNKKTERVHSVYCKSFCNALTKNFLTGSALASPLLALCPRSASRLGKRELSSELGARTDPTPA
ncbi:Protein of unknown function, partial [Gryllus bimaculatus]